MRFQFLAQSTVKRVKQQRERGYSIHALEGFEPAFTVLDSIFKILNYFLFPVLSSFLSSYLNVFLS
jgi:uncharacterized membrane protein (DUF485 family)